MDTYALVKNQMDNDLRTTLIGIMDKKQIPYNLNSNEDEDYYTTFFATNCDLKLPKKQQSKHRLANPQIDIFFPIGERFFQRSKLCLDGQAMKCLFLRADTSVQCHSHNCLLN